MRWPIYIFSFILPTTFILIGFIFWKHPPRKINSTAGWRTKQAMVNQETWDFANSLAGKCVLLLGGVEFIISLIAVFIFLLSTSNLNDNIVALFVLVIVVIQVACYSIVYIYVERKLKQHFSVSDFDK